MTPHAARRDGGIHEFRCTVMPSGCPPTSSDDVALGTSRSSSSVSPATWPARPTLHVLNGVLRTNAHTHRHARRVSLRENADNRHERPVRVTPPAL